MIYTKDLLLNSKYTDPLGLDGYKCLCSFGTADDVIKAPPNEKKENKSSTKAATSTTVMKSNSNSSGLEPGSATEPGSSTTSKPEDVDISAMDDDDADIQRRIQKMTNRDKNPEDKEDQDSSKYVRGPLKWMTVNPGQQSVGSFHPITDGEWMDGVHMSKSLTTLMDLCGNGDCL